MPQKLEKMTRSDYSVSASALKEIPDPEDREQIAALAYEFWQVEAVWTEHPTRTGFGPNGKSQN